jgi:hypothetical protein
VKLSVARGVALEIGHVDLGPSPGGVKYADLKASFGFEPRSDWRVVCDCEGPFRPVPPAEDFVVV